VWNLHKFILSARSPYFQKKLMAAPETAVWRLASTIPPEAFDVAVRYVYLGEVPSDLGLSNESTVIADDVLRGIDRVSKQLEMESFWEGLLSGNRRLARQRHQDEVTRGRGQIESWYRNNVLKNKISLDSSRASDVKWTRENGIFADVLLRADEVPEELTSGQETPKTTNTSERLNGIPIGPSENLSSHSPLDRPRQSVLFPVHRAMLLRSEYFQTMFTSAFQEAQLTDYLNIINVDCSPPVLQIVLDYLYTEKAHIPIELALDVLFAADMLFIEKLKTRATVVICTIGTGTVTVKDHLSGENVETESINIYDVIRAGWDLKVQRLEEFGGRYLAQRLEDYIDDEDFEKLIMESAERIENRQETDTIELLDEYGTLPSRVELSY
jgi:ankyrin repeat/BTB/POZ domain-containing protein 1